LAIELTINTIVKINPAKMANAAAVRQMYFRASIEHNPILQIKSAPIMTMTKIETPMII
jgi:hypothetical protein